MPCPFRIFEKTLKLTILIFRIRLFEDFWEKTFFGCRLQKHFGFGRSR